MDFLFRLPKFLFYEEGFKIEVCNLVFNVIHVKKFTVLNFLRALQNFNFK